MRVLVRFDEIFLKGKNQGAFIKYFKQNIEALFSNTTAKRTEGGLLVENFSEDPAERERLSLIPGVAKLSPVQVVPHSYDTLKKHVLGLKFDKKIQTFRVSANRSYKKYPLSSRQINEQLGAELIKAHGWRVNLKNPDLNIFIDIGVKEAFIYTEVTAGIGGLPVGSSGRAIVLLSGGIDSPVAAYLLMKRGVAVALVHFQNATQASEEVSRKIIDLARQLARYQSKIKLFIIPFAVYQGEIIKKIPAKYRMIIGRRMMFKLAAALAKKEKIFTLATGDSLAQVASQTLPNMRAIYESVDMLKLAPLAGLNKTEIIKIAAKIGTLKISERPYEDCCGMLVPKHPETGAKLEDVLKLEKNLDLSAIDRPKIISYNISIN